VRQPKIALEFLKFRCSLQRHYNSACHLCGLHNTNFEAKPNLLLFVRSTNNVSAIQQGIPKRGDSFMYAYRKVTKFVLAASASAILALAANRVASAQPMSPVTVAPNNYFSVSAAGSQYISNADDDRSGDGPECTLRDALEIINAGITAGPVRGCQITAVGAPTAKFYIVNLPPGGYTYTLAGEQLMIDTNSSVRIVGASRDNTVIQASAAPHTASVRVLEVSDATVEIDNVTIRHGQVLTAEGGGIKNDGHLTLKGCLFTANQARNGGAIWSDDTLEVESSQFVTNQAPESSGGAIHFDVRGTSMLTVTSSQFYSNTAFQGGGIDISADLSNHASIVGSTFSGNAAVPFGGWEGLAGAVNNDGATVSIVDGRFVANTAYRSFGGAIHNSEGSMALSASVFYSNTTEAACVDGHCDGGNGGAIRNEGVLTITATSFDYNKATGASAGGGVWKGGHGGAVENITGATLTVIQSSFTNNTAVGVEDGGGNGGAIDTAEFQPGVVSSLVVSASEFSNNHALGNIGGAICIYAGDGGIAVAEVVNSTIHGNSSNGTGGGISNHGVLTVTNSTITNNSSAYGGGGIVQFGWEITPVLTIHNSIIFDNVDTDCAETGGPSTVSGGHNIAGNNECGFSASKSNPLLGPLAANGGPTRTQALLPGSPAIDAADPTYCPSTDQRGIPRMRGVGAPACDIGAYELRYAGYLPMIWRDK
jgi:hypothetical protein